MRPVLASIVFCLLASSVIAADLQRLVDNSLLRTEPSLGAHFAETVEVSLPDEEDVYSAAQARAVFQGFLSQGQNWRFSLVHKGRSPKGSEYYIGMLYGSPGAFRMYIHTSETSGSMMVEQLRLDRE